MGNKEPDKTEIEKMSGEELILKHGMTVWESAQSHYDAISGGVRYPAMGYWLRTYYSQEILKRMEYLYKKHGGEVF